MHLWIDFLEYYTSTFTYDVYIVAINQYGPLARAGQDTFTSPMVVEGSMIFVIKKITR